MTKNSTVFKSFNKLLQLFILYSENNPQIFKIWCYVLYIFPQITTTLLVVIRLHLRDVDVAERNFMLPFVCKTIFCCRKIIAFLKKSWKIRKCIQFVFELNFTLQCIQEDEILKRSFQFCRKLCRIFLILIFLCIILWCSKSFSSKTQDLPLHIWLPCGHSLQASVYVEFCFCRYV